MSNESKKYFLVLVNLFYLLVGTTSALNIFVCDEAKNSNFHVDLCTIRGINTRQTDAFSFTTSNYISTIKFVDSLVERIPPEFFREMPSVSLVIERVGLLDLDPLTFRNAIGLREFRAHGNSISKIWRKNFIGAPHLQLIDFSANEIYTINQDAFEGLTILRWLDLSQNNIKVIDNNWFKHSNFFVYISLANNFVQDAILDLKHAVSLTTLDLASEKYHNPNLMFLYMNLNCKHLTNLDLSFNVNLKQISVYCAEKGTKETALFISHTNLGAINPALVIDPRLHLTKLVANNANYTRLQEISSFESTLKYLSLQSQTIAKGLPLLNVVQKLEYLSLRDSGMSEVNGEVLKKMHNLTQLDLGANNIKEIDWESFKGLNNLEELELDQNQLSNINGTQLLEALPNLVSINVRGNPIPHELLTQLFLTLDEADVVLKF